MARPVRITIVRHGRPTALYGDHPDPGLGEEGRAQAAAAADALAAGPPARILTSPLRRARETAAPLEQRWGTAADVEPAVGELAPADPAVDRRAWLRAILLGTWDDAPDDALAWRRRALDALVAPGEDTVVFTHYVVVNAALGAAREDRRVVSASPDYASRHVFEVVGGRLRLVALGAERATTVG